MNNKKLERERELLVQRFKQGFKIATGSSKIGHINDNLFYPLLEEERKQLEDGDGDELSWKTSRVNSSACLLLNTFTPMRQGNSLSINNLGVFNSYRLEDKLQVLNGSVRKANIDMVISNNETVVYIESKFIELFYYDKKHQLSESYFSEDKYPTKDIYQASKQLFNLYNYFDGNQLIKHAIGIYRDCLDNKEKYLNKKVKLLNLAWELHDTTYKYEDSFRLQLRAIKEATMFTSMFNKLMKKAFKKIGVDFEFIYMNYYDFIHHHTDIGMYSIELLNYLDKRYFFYHKRKENMEDKIDYIKSCIENDLSMDDLEDFLDKFKIINVQEIYQIDEISYKEEYMMLSDVIVLVGPHIINFPKNYDPTNVNEFLHIVSPLFYNRYTIIYLSKDLPRIKHYLIN
ncbi:hypothetical protein HF295_07270 [Hujiaoplasma nucleasis]|uniref:Uncharacterized protein n=1 Tax=Hujiaoplasma nucleasis TaxID=2725268 RepID=A0A7L6N6N5_9MOLU|nr:hypothetical protein [Hujiaoplasma nucleasis]QLY40655.1 hypothetical protein HF295_07270 [Hujiaoplasma nucleasis]